LADGGDVLSNVGHGKQGLLHLAALEQRVVVHDEMVPAGAADGKVADRD
jgi:hypothetical protein